VSLDQVDLKSLCQIAKKKFLSYSTEFLYYTHCIVSFSQEDFNLAFWAICNIKINDIFCCAWIFVCCKIFSNRKTCIGTFGNKTGACLCTYSLLIISYSWLVPCSSTQHVSLHYKHTEQLLYYKFWGKIQLPRSVHCECKRNTTNTTIFIAF